MTKFQPLAFLFLIPWMVQAQFINNGASVTIQSGAVLRIETDFINNSGTVTNQGTMEVSGDFTNAATGIFTSDPGTTIRFIGGTDSEVTSNGVSFAHVDMAKDPSFNMILQDDMTISETLTFTEDNNKVLLGDSDLTVSAVASADDNEYVVTNGTGSLIKNIAANGTVTHEIGDLDNASFVSSDVTGSAYTDATLSARVITTGLTDKIFGATDYINREWQITATGITDYQNTMTGTYVSADAVGTQSLITGSTFHTNDWFFNGSDNGPLEVLASTDELSVSLSGQNKFTTVPLKAFLAGALSGGTMTKTLNTNNLIPLESPYTVSPFNAPSVTAPSIPADATDWILIEVRDATTPSTIISQTSGFILDNGNIVAADGGEFRLKDAPASGHIAVRHRNHLAIRTPSPMDFNNPPALYDFTTGTSQAYTDTNITSNANMRNVGGVFAMWAGDVNNDGRIRYLPSIIPLIPSDALAILSLGLGGNASSSQTNVYSNYDVNLDRHLRYLPSIVPLIPSDALYILSNTLGGISNSQITNHF